MIRQAIIAAGGKGLRLGALSKRYGNKSLVTVRGIPLVKITVDWLREVGISDVIIAVNYRSEYKKIATLFRNDVDVTVLYLQTKSGSANCIPALKDRLNKRFFFVYGHAPVPPEHLLAMLRKEALVVSLYPTTTQEVANRKPALLKGNVVTTSVHGTLFIEPPHVLTRAFVERLAEVGSWKRAFQDYRGRIQGVLSSHPPEFHYYRDFCEVRRFLLQRRQKRP